MTTQNLVRKAVEMQVKARTFLENRIAELRNELTETEEMLTALSNGQMISLPVSRAKEKTRRGPGRPPGSVNTPTQRRANAVRRAAIVKRTAQKDAILAKLPDSFDRELFDKKGLAPIVLAHWIRAGKIRKTAKGYRKLGQARKLTAPTTIQAAPATATAAATA